MSLASGVRFGPYEVVALVGAGGMGEVYRARDTRLHRDVAIKILPQTLTDNALRRTRFEREAQLISRLNHPNVCALYDIGTQDGAAYLVMEYIEGESLAELLRRGPLSARATLRLAIQIAAGLDAAHRRGIIHRDLKPANVVVADETVKLLDFGLAKLQRDFIAEDAALLDATVSLTAERTVVGTLHYMSPEQLEGRETDRRTDVFAFGTVLHEMLTGRKAFDGTTDANVIAAILTTEPPPVSSSMAPGSIASPTLDHIVHRALAKNPDERWQTARDIMNELQWILESQPRTVAALRMRAATQRIARPALAVVVIVAGLSGGATLWKATPAVPAPIHVSFVRPIGLELTNTGRPILALSPDGRAIVLNANNQLYIRRLDAADLLPIPGTEGNGVQTPFFSPDGRWVAFFTADTHELKKVPVDGGAAVTVARSPASPFGNFGASWTADDQILFGTTEGVFTISANGGTPTKIIDPRPGETLYGPQMLPDGDHLLLTVTTATGIDRWDKARIIGQSRSSGTRTVLVEGGADGRYLDTGHIVYAAGTTLFAVPVDIRSLRTLGPPVTVLRDVGRSPVPAVNTANAFVAISQSGDLAYISKTTDALIHVSVDLAGRITPLPDRDLGEVRVSPDGSQIVALRGPAWWIYSLSHRAAPRRIAAAEGANTHPLWTPDGSRITFRSRRESGSALVSLRADGTGLEELLLPLDGTPVGWSRDGKTLYYLSDKQLWSWRRGGQKQSLGRVDAPYASLSPDRNWVAFHTYERGHAVPYIQSLSNGSVRFRVSENDGHAPLWSPDGGKLFYVSGATNSLMMVAVQTKPAVVFGDPIVLAPEIGHGLALGERRYDVTPDGQHVFVQIPERSDPRPREVHVVLNWFGELNRRAPYP